MPQKTARPPAIIVPDEDDFGPAMKELAPGQRAFVCAMVQSPLEPTKAAELAGLGGTPGSTQVTASKFMRNPKIIAALREEADRRFQSGALLGVHVIMEIARTTGHKDQLKAAERLVEQNGFVIAQLHKIEHEHKHTLSLEELRRSIVDDMKELGLPLPQEVLEGEFTELSSEGLEDVLA